MIDSTLVLLGQAFMFICLIGGANSKNSKFSNFMFSGFVTSMGLLYAVLGFVWIRMDSPFVIALGVFAFPVGLLIGVFGLISFWIN